MESQPRPSMEDILKAEIETQQRRIGLAKEVLGKRANHPMARLNKFLGDGGPIPPSRVRNGDYDHADSNALLGEVALANEIREVLLRIASTVGISLEQD